MTRHSASNSSLPTPHSSLHPSHSKLHTPNFTLPTPHFTQKSALLALVSLLFAWVVCSFCTSRPIPIVQVEEVPQSVKNRMMGKSYKQGCGVSWSELRYVTVLHYDLQGQVKRGELVVNKAIAQDVKEIFQELYRQKYPIESIRLIDEYNADDETSMRANNTSAFCYRPVAGTKTLSKHSLGRAVDINPLYNPCVRLRTGKVQPSNAKQYTNRNGKFPCKITTSDLAYRLFTQHGFKWGGHWKTVKDYQHFEK